MKCSRKEQNCFGRATSGQCTVLSDTLFTRPGGCPFYKPMPETNTDEYYVVDIPGRWKAVKGFAGAYLISDRGGIINKYHKPISQRPGAGGRPSVQLFYGASTYRYYIADLVADAFLPGTGAVGHKDGDINNCDVANLYRIPQKGGR